MLNLPTSGEMKDRPKELDKYIREIKSIFKTCGKKKFLSKIENANFSFTNLDNKIYASCYTYFNQIDIDIKSWKSLPDYSREELLLHEIGHCVMDKVHSETGIMKSAGMLKIDYIKNYKKHINDFFDCRERECCDIVWKEGKYND